MPNDSERGNVCANMVAMAVNKGEAPHTHFGRQMRKERLAKGWTLRELAAKTGITFSYLGMIETGKRPPNERVAAKMDEVFPKRQGWFAEYYEESKSWMPPGFRDWSEYEHRATELTIWVPNVPDGVAQTPDYARAVLQTYPGVTDDVIEARLRNRMERQQRLLRDDGPTVVLLVDQVALYRATGSAEVMAAQCQRLMEVAVTETVTLQIVPPVSHPLATAVAVVSNEAAYTENALGGSVYTSEESVTRLRRLVGSVRGEAAKVSESLTMIQEAERQWSGVRARTARTAVRHA